MRLLAKRQRRRRAGIHEHEQSLGRHALIAGMRRVARPAPRARRHRQGSSPSDRRRSGPAVEQREISVAVTEETQHRHHAVDGVEQGAGGGMCGRRTPGSGSRSISSSSSAPGLRLTCPPSGRIWLSSSSPSLLLAVRKCGCPAMLSAAAVSAIRLQPLHALRARNGMAQVADLPRQAARKRR